MRGSEVVRHVRKETGLVGRNVESLRKAQGLSKTCLSAMAGVCRQELAKVEKGEVSAALVTGKLGRVTAELYAGVDASLKSKTNELHMRMYATYSRA